MCHKLGISQATFYNWKKQYAGLGVQELRELRQLREENGRLKRIVADLTLDRQILQEIVSDYAMNGAKVAAALTAAASERGGLPESITCDNSSEFAGRVMEVWAMKRDVKLCFIRPG